ncbi:MAG: family 1 glycosylhydrolase [Phycisphaerae bacterium]
MHVPDAGPPDRLQVDESVARQAFMFAAGIECSYPTIAGGRRIDQLEVTGHYEHWRKDLDLAHGLGLKYLRYGPPLHRVWTGPGRYDFSWLDGPMARMQELGIWPIIDLLHFGLPDWLNDADPAAPAFQNPAWPEHFADYAAAFAQRYPHVRLYTPVNEIYVTALFSGLYGWWNERLTADSAFVTNVKHCVKASVLAMRRLLNDRPDAIFVFSESTEYVHPGSPQVVSRARLMNERRFVALDLLFAHDVSATMYRYLTAGGMTEAEYLWHMDQSDLKRHCILGTDYYITNEHVLHADGSATRVGDVYGYYVITRQYYDRYGVHVMHTETNRAHPHAVEWLWKEWMNLMRLRDDGVPVIGFTWFGLLDMMDWDSALTNPRGHVNPVGLFDLRRRPRPVAKAYRELIEHYSHLDMSRSKLPLLTA